MAVTSIKDVESATSNILNT